MLTVVMAATDFYQPINLLTLCCCVVACSVNRLHVLLEGDTTSYIFCGSCTEDIGFFFGNSLGNIFLNPQWWWWWHSYTSILHRSVVG